MKDFGKLINKIHKLRVQGHSASVRIDKIAKNASFLDEISIEKLKDFPIDAYLYVNDKKEIIIWIKPVAKGEWSGY